MKAQKTCLLLSVVLLFGTVNSSSDGLWYFGSGQGDWPNNLLNDTEGNLIISGHSYGAFEGIPNRDPSNTTADAFLFKVTTNQEILWKLTFGTSAEDRVTSFCFSSDGNILISGFTRGNFANGLPSTNYDMFLAKYNIQDGVQIWNVTFGTPSSEDCAEGVSIDADGNIFLSADSDGVLFGSTACASFTNIWVLKLDSDGNLLDGVCFGSELFDIAQQLTVQGDSVFVSGHTNGTFAGNTAAGLMDIWAAKISISPSLSLDWVSQIGSSKDDQSYDVVMVGDFIFVGGYISADISQESEEFQGFTDFALLKFSASNGTYQGAATGGGLLLEAFVKLFVDEEDYVYATGYTTSSVLKAEIIGNVDGLVVKFDPDTLEGVEAWIGGDALKYDSCFGSVFVDGSLYCVGSNALTTSLADTQAFLLKMENGKDSKSEHTVEIAVGVSVGGAALIGIFVGGFLYYKKKLQRSEKPKIEMPMIRGEIVEIQDVQIHEKLGVGNFGEVFRGTWQGTTPCALKKLKNPDMASEFMNEANLLQQLSQPNVVRFFGIFKDAKGSQYLVTEFMSRGALNILLQEKHEELTDLDLLMMARDAAAGMQYLASKGIIHRDLAARNLLVKEEEGRLVVKVADFGLSRVASEYYQSSGSTFPVKWSAPEVLNFSKYSSQSDVWSFGIVLWEIFELGRVPYTGKTNDETIELVLGGYRLPVPKICPEGIYELMQQCWKANASERPTFGAIYESLTEILKRSGWQNPQAEESLSSEEGLNSNYSENALQQSQSQEVQKSDSATSVYFSQEKKDLSKPESDYAEFEE